MRLLLLCCLCLILLAGCGIDYKCEVTSNTSWSGIFADRTVDGEGDQTVDIPDDPPECVVVQKETEKGYLRIKLIAEGGWFLNSADDRPSVTTTAKYGIVSDCTHKW
ncbi:MAG TPA: hypothetical protein VMY05_00340 [Acidobacteriota bacterium]|nr:hypothetical protein [Acidobacteriota bacterium]